MTLRVLCSAGSALLNIHGDDRVDVLFRWDANCYCQVHRHTCHVSSTVLQGELEVIDVDPATGAEVGRTTRTQGDFRSKGPGDVHIERGGAEGALVLFSLSAPDGSITEALADDGSVISETTVEAIRNGLVFS